MWSGIPFLATSLPSPYVRSGTGVGLLIMLVGSLLGHTGLLHLPLNPLHSGPSVHKTSTSNRRKRHGIRSLGSLEESSSPTHKAPPELSVGDRIARRSKHLGAMGEKFSVSFVETTSSITSLS
jgi:hypothetical protein